MDELTMKEISPGDLFSHRRKDNGSISPPPPRVTTSPSIPTTTLMTNGNSLSPNNGPLDLKNNLAMIMESYSDPTHTTTWHQTVPEYSKPLHVPTPFTIKDILGLADEESAHEEENQEVQDDDEEEEEKVETTTTEMVTMMEDPMTMSPPIPAATTPSPQPMSTMQLDDEPLNLTVVKREPSPSSEETNNNNRLVNGSGRLFMNRNKSPNNGPLLPNDVIIPKVKHPTNAGTGLKNGTKSKGCGAINLKTSTKRKAKDRRGGPSPKMLAVSIDTTHGDEAGTPTPTHNTTLLSPSLENGSSSNDSKKRKKARTTFTGKQIYELERQFEIKKYLSSTERSEMARILNVTEVQVKIWFQNRRTKWKKQDNISNAEAAEHKVMATKGPGSKKDKNSHNHSKGTSGKKTVGAGSGGGRLPGTSECSFSISGSIDSSDDHSNCASLSEHGSGNTSEGASVSENKHQNNSSSKLTISTTIAEDFSLLQQKLHHNQLQQPLIVPSPTSVLLSHLASALNHKSPDPSLSPLAAAPTAEVELPRRGRSPPISIPHYLFSSTALLGGIQPPVSLASSVGTEKEGGDENDDEDDVDNENAGMSEITMNHQGHDHDDEDQEEEELEEHMMQIVEDDPPNNVLVSVCGSSLEKGHVDPEGDCSGSGGECHQGGDDIVSDGEEDVEIAAAASVNKDLESSNKTPFGPVSQAS